MGSRWRANRTLLVGRILVRNFGKPGSKDSYLLMMQFTRGIALILVQIIPINCSHSITYQRYSPIHGCLNVRMPILHVYNLHLQPLYLMLLCSHVQGKMWLLLLMPQDSQNQVLMLNLSQWLILPFSKSR